MILLCSHTLFQSLKVYFLTWVAFFFSLLIQNGYCDINLLTITFKICKQFNISQQSIRFWFVWDNVTVVFIWKEENLNKSNFLQICILWIWSGVSSLNASFNGNIFWIYWTFWWKYMSYLKLEQIYLGSISYVFLIICKKKLGLQIKLSLRKTLFFIKISPPAKQYVIKVWFYKVQWTFMKEANESCEAFFWRIYLFLLNIMNKLTWLSKLDDTLKFMVNIMLLTLKALYVAFYDSFQLTPQKSR